MEHQRRRRRARRQGMTLIEIMIVVVIMAMMAAAVGMSVMGTKHDAELRLARTDLQNLTQVAEAYLLTRPGAGCPDITALQEARLLRRGSNTEDPWGTPYQLSCDDGEVDVRSAGPDEEPGTADDITLAR